MAADQPSTKRNTGGGQKSRRQKRKREKERKREEEEGDPDSSQIGSGGRLRMLESVEGIIKRINSVVCFPYPADGCMGFRPGFRPETVTLEEERIAGLIYSNVCTYIVLYHLEKKRTVDNSSLIRDILKLAGDGPVLTDCDYVADTLWGVESQLRTCTQPLLDRRRSLVDHPTPRHHPSVDSGTTEAEASSVFKSLGDYALGLHKRELMAVLRTLEVIGRARGYAPPEDGKEILFYKQIRKQIASFILHAHTRATYHALASPFCLLDSPGALCFVPPTLQLEVALEQMHEHRAIFKELTQRVTHHLSSCPAPVPVMFRDLLDIMEAKDASLSPLLARMPKQESFVTTRSACLDRIIAILGRIKPFGEQTPTVTEVRMYALLGEHVRSSLWLCSSRTLMGKRSCEVYLSNAPTDGDRSSLSGTLCGECKCTREQLLEQIMPYLRALKSSYMDDVPSWEEEKKYHSIWAWLRPGLLMCMSSRPMPHVDEEAGQVSELERKVSFIYNKVLSFLAAIKEEIPSVAAAVHHAMLPERQQVSPQDALDWLIKCGDDAATDAKEFVDRSMSDGTMAHLDHALVMLAELENTGIFFSRLSDVVYCVDVENVRRGAECP